MCLLVRFVHTDFVAEFRSDVLDGVSVLIYVDVFDAL